MSMALLAGSAHQQLFRQHASESKLGPAVRLRRPFISKQGKLLQGKHRQGPKLCKSFNNKHLLHSVRNAVAAPPAPVAEPTKGQTSHADEVAAKDAPLKSLFPSEPKVVKVLADYYCAHVVTLHWWQCGTVHFLHCNTVDAAEDASMFKNVSLEAHAAGDWRVRQFGLHLAECAKAQSSHSGQRLGRHVNCSRAAGSGL